MRRLAALVAVAVLAACGSGDTSDEEPAAPCTPDTCQAVPVALDGPMTLDEARAEADGLGGRLIAVRRTTPACVTQPPMEPSIPSRTSTSRFAYVRGDDLVAALLEELESQPPVTDGGVTFARYDRMREEWRAVDDETRLDGVVVLVPDDVGIPGGGEPLEWRPAGDGFAYLRLGFGPHFAGDAFADVGGSGPVEACEP